MHAALDVNVPNYAAAIVSAKEIIVSMSSPSKRRADRDKRSAFGAIY